MSSQTAEALGTPMITADEVAQFLKDKPEFLIEQEGLLESIELSHGNGASFSLIERQVQRLRDENQSVKSRLNEYLEVSHANDDIANRLHELTVALIGETNLQQFVQILRQHLQRDFNIDYVSVTMITELEGIEDLPRIDPASKQGELFSDVLSGYGALVGRIGSARVNALFGDAGEEVCSAAVISLGGKMGGKTASKPIGLLALGSSDEQRFTAVAGNDLLNRLGGMLGAMMLRNVADKAAKLASVK
jgi:uncharacterized protein YigA (DUF484 family)